MDSLFFNITDTKYKVTELLNLKKEYLRRVDISNGIVFMEGNLFKNSQDITLKNLDRMIMIVMVKKGVLELRDHISESKKEVKGGEIGIFFSSNQNMTLSLQKSQQTEVLVLFIADFFLKRYLSNQQNEPIDFIYAKTQKEVSLECINIQPIDALSLYIIENLLNIAENRHMQSIRAEHRVIEFLIHRLSLLDIIVAVIDEEELTLASRAKNILLQDFISPPTIQRLAHLCATNESKLKKVFKKAYQTTLHGYVQKLRLDKANLLLKEENLTIGEIAKQVGYKHQGYFSKLFFNTYGVYPTALAKKSFLC